MRALISRAQRAFANCDKTASIMIVIALVLLGLVINGALILTHYWVITNEVAGFLQRPVIKGQDDVAYLKSYISPNLYLTKQEWQPKSTSILCDNSTETVTSVYLYSRLHADGKYRGALTCPDTLQNNICSGHSYLEDPKLKEILNSVSPYLTYNLLTENDLQMASLALEYKKRAPSTYKPNYEDPKIAYLFMSESTPSWLHYAFDHIFNKTSKDTLVYSTFDYNSAMPKEFSNVIQRYPQVKELPARWFGNWGGISLVYMEVSGWLELLKEEGWDYLINVSDGDGFILSADVIQQRVKELNGQSILECSYEAPYYRGHNDSCLHLNDGYRYDDVWLDCGSSIRTVKHPKLSPKYPPYLNRALKASQWKVLTRSVIEKLVASQDFWDILFSHRYAMIPDEHAIVNAVKRILPNEPFIYHNVHWKSWNGEKYFDEQDVLSAIERGSWFIRRIRKLEEWAVVERVREEQYAKNLLKNEELTPII